MACIHKNEEQCTLSLMACSRDEEEQLDCEDYIAEDPDAEVDMTPPVPLFEEEYDPCDTCERDDCYQILYGRCDRKG